MRKNWRFLAVAGISVMVLATAFPVSAKSLWSNGDGHTENLYFSDNKARNVGDILTIIISETATTSATRSSSNSKSGNVNMQAGIGVFDFLNSIFPASISGSDNFKADGSSASTNRANGRVSVTVVEVEPNGNMIVEGTQSIWQNKNEHKITLRGVVRRERHPAKAGTFWQGTFQRLVPRRDRSPNLLSARVSGPTDQCSTPYRVSTK